MLKSQLVAANFDIDIRVYRPTTKIPLTLWLNGALRMSNRASMSGKLEAKQLLNDYNGIGVYRSGFRIRPLGDAEYDWLKLNARRVQNPSMRILETSRQSDMFRFSPLKPGLDWIEKSARDGLRENQAFGRLQRSYSGYYKTELESASVSNYRRQSRVWVDLLAK